MLFRDYATGDLAQVDIQSTLFLSFPSVLYFYLLSLKKIKKVISFMFNSCCWLLYMHILMLFFSSEFKNLVLGCLSKLIVNFKHVFTFS